LRNVCQFPVAETVTGRRGQRSEGLHDRKGKIKGQTSVSDVKKMGPHRAKAYEFKRKGGGKLSTAKTQNQSDLAKKERIERNGQKTGGRIEKGRGCLRYVVSEM